MSADLISSLLFFVPALLLGLSLLLGHRPGERLLIRWATTRTQRHRYTPLGPNPVRNGWVWINPRGGRLLARSLAGRSPPRRPAPRMRFGRRLHPSFI
jgi:hypothetical protein